MTNAMIQTSQYCVFKANIKKLKDRELNSFINSGQWTKILRNYD